MSRTLVIGDIHEPVSHPGYLSFCRDTYEEYDCNDVVLIGDVVDWHGISFHARHPLAPGVKDEYELAKARIKLWYRAFPEAIVCIGNHDERLMRLAESVGIPSALLRDYADVWDTPNWQWKFDHTDTANGVYYFHGTGRSGINPAWNVAKDMGMSVVMGHVHSVAGVKWSASPTRRWFGMDTGCGVDDRLYAFAYNKHNRRRSVLGCGLVLDGIAVHEIMECGRGEKYDRKRFPKNPILSF